MILTLDDAMARLVTELKWADWSAPYAIAIALDESREVRVAHVIAADVNIDFYSRVYGMRIDYWSIADLFADLLGSLASGFSLTEPTGSQRYVLAMLEAIRRYERSRNTAG